MVIVNWEILWGCCTFHSLQGEHWPYTIFLFPLCHSPWLLLKAFYYGWRKNWSKPPITPPCNFEKLPDKKSETHTVVVALHSISCPRDLCWLFVACFDVFPYPPSLCSRGSGECKTCSEGFGLQCVNSSLSPSLCFCPVKPGVIGHLFTKMGSKRIPCYRRIPECSNGEWCSTACLMGNKQMEPVSSNMKTLERH